MWCGKGVPRQAHAKVCPYVITSCNRPGVKEVYWEKGKEWGHGKGRRHTCGQTCRQADRREQSQEGREKGDEVGFLKNQNPKCLIYQMKTQKPDAVMNVCLFREAEKTPSLLLTFLLSGCSRRKRFSPPLCCLKYFTARIHQWWHQVDDDRNVEEFLP